MEKKINQEVLLAAIVEVLKDGPKSKKEVEHELFLLFKEDLVKDKDYWTFVGMGGVNRWRAAVAFAKELGKQRGLIKSSKDSGRGIWELGYSENVKRRVVGPTGRTGKRLDANEAFANELDAVESAVLGV